MPCGAGPLEHYAARFDDLFGSFAHRRGLREYLAGLLARRDRNKTLTALAGVQHPAVQRLRFLLSESRWDPESVIEVRLLEHARGVPAVPGLQASIATRTGYPW